MDSSFDFDFRSLAPPFPLGRWVESVWYARGTVPYQREKIAPTGSTVAVLVLGDPIIETADHGQGESVETSTGFVLGPHDRPVINEPTGETYAVGVVCTPVGATPALGVRPASLRGRVRPIEDAWPMGGHIRHKLRMSGEPNEMLAAFMDSLTAEIGTAPPDVGLVERAIELLESDPTTPISEIAHDVGLSQGHLARVFTKVVGMTPRALARLLRMRRLLQGLDVDAEVGWAALAADLGWYDQAHLIRDFKRHTGVTPTEYLGAQRAVYSPVGPVDAAGFVPEP